MQLSTPHVEQGGSHLGSRSHDTGRAIEVAILPARKGLPVKPHALALVQGAVTVGLDAAED